MLRSTTPVRSELTFASNARFPHRSLMRNANVNSSCQNVADGPLIPRLRRDFAKGISEQEEGSLSKAFAEQGFVRAGLSLNQHFREAKAFPDLKTFPDLNFP